MPETDPVSGVLLSAMRDGLNLMAMSDLPGVRTRAINMVVGKAGERMSIASYREIALLALSERKWLPEERAILARPLTPYCWPAVFKRGYRKGDRRYTCQQMVTLDPRWKERMDWLAVAHGMTQSAYIRYLIERDYDMMMLSLKAGKLGTSNERRDSDSGF